MNPTEHSSFQLAASAAWRTLTHFCAFRQLRLTVCLVLAGDGLLSFSSKYDFNDTRELVALIGLGCVLLGLTLMLSTIDNIFTQAQSLSGVRHEMDRSIIQFATLAALLGLCALCVYPKNVVLVIAPFLLLPIQRVWRANCAIVSATPQAWGSVVRSLGERASALPVVAATAATQAGNGGGTLRKRTWPAPLSTRLSWAEQRLLRSRRYAPTLMFPLVAVALIRFDWPFGSIHFHEIWEMHCLALSFAGLVIRAITVGHSPGGSPSTSRRKAKALLETGGMYSVVRHPLYVGDYLIGLGVVLVPFVWWLPVVYSVAFGLYYTQLIVAHEKLLRANAGSGFDRWASVTPACIPRLSLWRPSDLPFSYRRVIRREHKALLLTIALHAGIEWLEHWLLEQRIITELFWILLVLIGLGAFVTVYILEKYTQVLKVEPQYEC